MLQLEEGQACQKWPDNGKTLNYRIRSYMPNPWNGYYIYGLGISCPSKIVIQSVLVQTSPVPKSVVLVPSLLRNTGLLAGQLGPDFPVLISVSTHAMVELRVT
ncbi:MAG: hypothetical protein EZS28_018856 [Streblomastix strix]|uniref:Uncharacterized protein n=1 Tax=Streblomastix strix TaxID=222440 RepID=A0A5J4VT50_9EUKA|nr:MAG: hypothetical protein EZS28_018856 [Streblomastix strix]